MKDGLHIDSHGNKFWYKNGTIHRDDGPAATYPDGTQVWLKDGMRHRNAGPAVIYHNGDQYWYKDDQPYEPSAHDLMVWKMNEKEQTKKHENIILR